MPNARFCLHTEGNGWGARVVDYMAMECLPLMVNDGMIFPYSNIINWDDFSIHLNKKHVPQNTSDTVLSKMVRVAYHTFNFMTGYDHADPPTSAIGYRLIILESVAGVPGMLGGMFRHFRSLRQLERDHGFIFTLLEEAENERMHLIVCMGFFEAGPVTRFVVQAGQVASTSTKRNLPCASPTSLRASSWNAKTAVRSTRIMSTPWRSCARASSNGNAKSKSPSKQSSASRWSQLATVRPKSVPTTTRRGESPITASNSHRTL